MRERPKSPRFDREAWLQTALEVMAKDGQAKLNVERLAAQLGVTKGSFYHHFRNRDDFMRQVLDYWELQYTTRQVDALESSKAPPCKRLFRIMHEIETEELSRYDIVFRSWAAQNTEVAAVVRRVDNTRFAAIRAIFADLGFEGDDLNERVRIWLLFHSALGSVHLNEAPPAGPDSLQRRLRFFTGAKCA